MSTAGDEQSKARQALEHCRALHRQGRQPHYEALLQEAYSHVVRPGDTVVDVGAHSGLHTLRLADIVGDRGTVIAFEPIPDRAAFLRGRVFPAPVTVREVALGLAVGEASFVHVVDMPEWSGLRERTYDGQPNPRRQSIKVRASTLDVELAAVAALSYIKLDVEGAEIDCLLGGSACIARLRPIISVEYGWSAYSHYGLTSADLFNWAARMGYVLGDLFGNPIATLDEWQLIVDQVYWDFILTPREKGEVLSGGLATLPSRSG